MEGLIQDVRNMWKLTLGEEERRNPHYHHRFYSYSYPGHNEKWAQLVITRPRILTMESICTLMGVGSIRDLVPFANRMQALLAVEQGDTIDVSQCVQGLVP